MRDWLTRAFRYVIRVLSGFWCRLRNDMRAKSQNPARAVQNLARSRGGPLRTVRVIQGPYHPRPSVLVWRTYWCFVLLRTQSHAPVSSLYVGAHNYAACHV